MVAVLNGRTVPVGLWYRVWSLEITIQWVRLGEFVGVKRWSRAVPGLWCGALICISMWLVSRLVHGGRWCRDRFFLVL